MTETCQPAPAITRNREDFFRIRSAQVEKRRTKPKFTLMSCVNSSITSVNCHCSSDTWDRCSLVSLSRLPYDSTLLTNCGTPAISDRPIMHHDRTIGPSLCSKTVGPHLLLPRLSRNPHRCVCPQIQPSGEPSQHTVSVQNKDRYQSTNPQPGFFQSFQGYCSVITPSSLSLAPRSISDSLT